MFPKQDKDVASARAEKEGDTHDAADPGQDESTDEHSDPESRPRSCSYVGPKMHVKGDVVVDESLYVDGRIEGTVTSRDKKLSVGKEGHVTADVHATVVEARGKIDGDVHATDVVHLYSTAVIRGSVRCARLIVDDGAVFDGQLQMTGEEQLEPKKGKLKLASSSDGGT